MRFIEILEKELGKKAKIRFLPMQDGDMEKTWADSSLLNSLTRYSPNTKIEDGIKIFVRWYKEYYHSKNF